MITIEGSFDEKIDKLKEIISEKPCLIMPSAIPGSGKSYISQKIAEACGEDKIKIVSTDAIRKELFGDEDSQEDNSLVFLTAFRKCRKWFYHGYSVVFDATNITRKSRNWVAKQAIPFSMTNDISRIIINIKVDLKTALKRNRSRDRFVPEDVIYEFNSIRQDPSDKECEYVMTIDNENIETI